MSTRERSFALLQSLGVAPIFLQAYQSDRLPHNLDAFFGCPEEFFLAPETQDLYTGGRLIPILDDGSFDCILFYDPAECNFLQKYAEMPDRIHDTFVSWQQYLASLMIRIIETGFDASELRQIAHLIDCRHLERTLEFVDARGEGAWDERRAAFLAAI